MLDFFVGFVVAFGVVIVVAFVVVGIVVVFVVVVVVIVVVNAWCNWGTAHLAMCGFPVVPICALRTLGGCV